MNIDVLYTGICVLFGGQDNPNLGCQSKPLQSL